MRLHKVAVDAGCPQTVKYLESVKALREEMIRHPETPTAHLAPFQYLGTEDYLLRHGAGFKMNPKRKVPRWMKGEPKRCFANAGRVVEQDSGFLYCEGYALVAEVGLPVIHAWVYDRLTGEAVEVTWNNDVEGVEYFGVMFKWEYVYELAVRRGHWDGVLDNWREKWPLLRHQPHFSEVLWQHKLIHPE